MKYLDTSSAFRGVVKKPPVLRALKTQMMGFRTLPRGLDFSLKLVFVSHLQITRAGVVLCSVEDPRHRHVEGTLLERVVQYYASSSEGSCL